MDANHNDQHLRALGSTSSCDQIGCALAPSTTPSQDEGTGEPRRSPSRRTDSRFRLRSVRLYFPLVVLSAAAGLDAGSVALLNSALPAIGKQFDASANALSWTVSGYSLAFASLLLCGGAMADRLDRRRVLIAGLALYTFGGMAAFAATSFWMIVVGRVLQGAGAALTMPAATSLLTLAYPADPLRSRAFGVFSSAQAACYAIGLVLGGLLTTLWGWTWVCAFQAAAAATTAAIAMRWLPKPESASQGRLDVAGAISLIAACTLIVVAIDIGPQTNWRVPVVLLVLGALAACVWRRRSRTQSESANLVARSLIALRSVRVAFIVACAFYFCVTGSLFLLPLYLQNVRGMTAAASGLAILPVSIAVTATSLLAGRLMNSIGPKLLMTVGMALTAAGVLLWATTTEGTPYWGTVLFGLVITGVGQGLTFPAIITIGLRDVNGSLHGMASALTVTALQVGGAIGPTILAGMSRFLSSDGGQGLSLSDYHLGFIIAAATLLGVGLPAVARLREASA